MSVEGLACLILPFILLLGRVSAFIAVMPILGWTSVPMVVRAGIAMFVTILFAAVVPPPALAHDAGWVFGTIMVVREVIIGLALGLAASIVFHSVQQAGRIISIQMGYNEADILDPVSGEPVEAMALLMEVVFALLFLGAGGHHLLLRALGRSYEVFPVAAAPSVGAMAEAIMVAGSAMFLFALRIAAPLVAAFLVLSVVLAVLARVLPEMNVLLASFPLRVGLGLLLAAALMPTLNDFAVELAEWLARNMVA